MQHIIQAHIIVALVAFEREVAKIVFGMRERVSRPFDDCQVSGANTALENV
jgi:hypothetical protein